MITAAVSFSTSLDIRADDHAAMIEIMTNIVQRVREKLKEREKDAHILF